LLTLLFQVVFSVSLTNLCVESCVTILAGILVISTALLPSGVKAVPLTLTVSMTLVSPPLPP